MPTLLGPELEAKDGELKIPGAVSALDRAAAALDTLTDSVNDLQAEVCKNDTQTEDDKKPAETETQDDKDVTKADEAKDASETKAEETKTEETKTEETKAEETKTEETAKAETETENQEDKKEEVKEETKEEGEVAKQEEAKEEENQASEETKEEVEKEAEKDEEKETAKEEEKEEVTEELTEKAVWTTAYINDLPDSAFLYVETDGKKNGEGKTVPRTKRHFPVYDHTGKLDLPHLRNAIARIPQSTAPGLDDTKKKSLQEKARKMLAAAQKSDTQKDDQTEEIKQPTMEALTGLFKSVATEALNLAGNIKASGIPKDLKATLGTMRQNVQDLTDRHTIKKSEDKLLPEVFSQEDIDPDALAKAFADTILDVAGRSASISHTSGDSLADELRKQISDVLCIVDALEEKTPVVTEKSTRVMHDTLMNVVARANVLCEKASEDKGQIARDIKHVQILLKAMTDKYDTSEADLDFGDYGLVMQADKTLGALEEALIEKKVETAPADPPETKSDDVDVAKQNKALTDRVEALVGQVNELKAVVAKARGTVPPPASQDEAKPGENKDVLFPADYNSAEYRGATKEQDEDTQDTKLF